MAIVNSHKESLHVLSGDKPGIKTQVERHIARHQ